jgi:hypothetical protein
MLNELYLLSGALNASDIDRQSWHEEYKPLPKATPKAPCFRIWLSDLGVIMGMELLAPELVRVLRKYGNNQASFPAFNIKPLYRVTDSGQKREDNWLKSMKRTDNSIESISGRLQNAIGGIDNESLRGVIKLIETTRLLTKSGFRNALEQYLTVAVAMGNTELRGILEFVGNDNKPPENDMGANISVILDLENWDNYGHPIASEETTHQINDALNQYENGLNRQGNALDAFGDLFDETAPPEPMPEVSLPWLGKVTLRAMFNGQPCQERYGRFDDASYSISKPNRDSTKTALEWVSKADNEYVTWVKAAKDEIVFAYPSELPKIPLKSAAIFGGIGAKGRFEELSKDFLKAFKGIQPRKRPKYIRVFSIRKADKLSTRSKVVLTRNITPEDYIEAAKQWERGCANIPPMPFSDAGVPFPLNTARIINTVWKQDGSQVKRKDGTPIVRWMQYHQGIELMLDFGKNSAAYYMGCFVANVFGLVVFSGNCRSLPQKSILDAMTILGLLLHKRGIVKEVYMKDTAFLTGRLLKLSDELHALYGRVVRDDVSRKLVGASMLATASDMPDRAISVLCVRMSPYLTWAKSYRYENIQEKDKESWKAGWLLKMFGTTASELRETLTEPRRLDDFEKAQLFLGYLASFPKRDAEGNHNKEVNDNEQK